MKNRQKPDLASLSFVADRTTKLESLSPGMPIIFGGNRVAYVSDELAAAFRPGDRIAVTQDDGVLLHIPRESWKTAETAVTSALGAFGMMSSIAREAVSNFYGLFAENLADDGILRVIREANESDVRQAQARGRSTTRLTLSDRMHAEMVESLRALAATTPADEESTEHVRRQGMRLELRRSGLGVVGFVFEGRPNVFADATGVLRSGNAVVFRIGSDALQTARAIMARAVVPALEGAGLPHGVISLLDTTSRAAGWALFSDPRLALAVARGSGAAVTQLGDIARQAGTPVSLHGTGGAWIVAGETADEDEFRMAVHNSLDRKVCNTLNTCCIVESRASDLVPKFLDAIGKAGESRGATGKLHATKSAMPHIPETWRKPAEIKRSGGISVEPQTELIEGDRLGQEWEWEESPEVTLAIVSDVDEAVGLFNAQSPKFAASLISADPIEHEAFFEAIESPFVGNGFTRWVDGQYALGRPELGLSNWQYGRIFGRSGILSGDGVYTIKTRAIQEDHDLHR